MSPPWARSLEVDRLADGGAEVDFAVPLAELTGLRSLRAGVSGEVHGRATFTRRGGVVVAQLELAGTARLQCQRCMQLMDLPLEETAAVGLVNSDAEASRVPEDLEPMLAAGGRISIGELITEELLLALPIVPLHARPSDCGVPEMTAAGEPAPEQTHRPFAQLGDLLKR